MRALFQYMIAALVLVFSAFMAFWLFLAFIVVAVGLFAYIHAKRWWRRQQSEATASSTQDTPQVMIIEGQFETVEVLPEPEPHSPPQEPRQ